MPGDIGEPASTGQLTTVCQYENGNYEPDHDTDGLQQVEESGSFTLGDLVTHLSFVNGTLCLSTDYLRGRMMKTDVTVHADGRIEHGARPHRKRSKPRGLFENRKFLIPANPG